MEAWSTHHLFKKALDENLQESSADNAQKYAAKLRSKNLPVIFSLRHLSKITGTEYLSLHSTVNRKKDSCNYSIFSIKKRSGGRRFIHAVNHPLFSVQKFINCEILQNVKPHHSSFAFHRSGGIKKCADMHCGAKWILSFDLKDFFYSIKESSVYEVFAELGYKSLLAFEMARLCTTRRLPQKADKYLNYQDIPILRNYEQSKSYPYEFNHFQGVLPQGAPSSPMLSNLVARTLDEALYSFSQENSFIYTRYADDLTFSATRLPEGKSIGRLKMDIISIIRRHGFIENPKKIRIAGSGSKKVVLGLLVDGDRSRISKEMYKRIDRLLHAATKYGIEDTASHEGFKSAYGLFNHLKGLLLFVKDVDFKRWEFFQEKFQEISGPWENLI